MLLEINLGVVCQLSGLLSSPGPGGYNIVLYYTHAAGLKSEGPILD